MCCPDGVRCGTCGETKPSTEFYADRSKRHGHATVCKDCTKARSAKRTSDPETRDQALAYMRDYAKRPEIVERRRQREAEDRQKVIELYGGACACCGEREPAFLTLDHVEGDGAAHRAADPLAGSIVKWHRRHGFKRSDRFQLLCWNCNCAKGIRGACPHEAIRQEASCTRT